MNTKLIRALHLTANQIENGTFPYDWYSLAQCNSGALACALLGISPNELDLRLPPYPEEGKDWADWREYTGYYCTMTGLPVEKILLELAVAGLTRCEILNLEDLSSAKVLAEVNKNRFFKRRLNNESPTDVALYMRAWARLLEREDLEALRESSRRIHEMGREIEKEESWEDNQAANNDCGSDTLKSALAGEWRDDRSAKVIHRP